MRSSSSFLLATAACALVAPLHAADPAPTPGFPEPVVQWGAQQGETCGDIANALYGSPKYAHLLMRYNRISCSSPLPESITLIAPARVTSIPSARLRSMHPDVQTRPPGGAWSPGASGQPLGANHNVQTQDQGRADIEFVDRTRVFLAPHTLVVIFDTANQTRVSKVAPPRVEVQEGEVRAGLSALRGAPIEVAVPGGGQVSATSRDTVVARKGERTTVAVFDGKAGVRSGGKSVEVPTNFGTRFVGQKPPDPPRPLPPAPVFREGTSGLISVDTAGQLKAQWEPVPSAASYRVEVAREADFGSLMVREEVGGDITSFRAEKLPPGRYFLRVRAIDKEDYLGIAATRSMALVGAEVTGGSLEGNRLSLRRNAQIKLKAPAGVEIAADGAAFGPVPESLALPSPLPSRLRLRVDPAQPPLEIAVALDPLRGEVTTRPEASGKVRVLLRPEGRTPDEALAEGHPRARVAGGSPRADVPLARVDEQHLGALIDAAPGEQLRIEIVDDSGAALGSASHRSERPRPPEAPPLQPPILGAVAPLWAHQPDASPVPLSPRATNAASLAALAAPGDSAALLLDARASGHLRHRLGVDAAIRTRLKGDAAADGLAWLGLRGLLYGRLDREQEQGQGTEIALLAHGSLPTTAAGQAPSVEPALALGGLRGNLSWAINVGGRARVLDRDSYAPTARLVGFVSAELALRLSPLVRAYVAADGRALSVSQGEALRGGGAVGVEAGKTWFIGAALRGGLGEASSQGATTAQLTLGLRDSFL